MEKLFTVEDIARMTSMTTRTIRNYLKAGTLKGRKIGGQWRFTGEDIANLMDIGSVSEEMSNNNKQAVIDFIDGVNTNCSDEIQVCAIIDLYHEISVAAEKRDKVLELVNFQMGDKDHMRFVYEYFESEQKGRITLFVPPNLLIEALKALQYS